MLSFVLYILNINTNLHLHISYKLCINNLSSCSLKHVPHTVKYSHTLRCKFRLLLNQRLHMRICVLFLHCKNTTNKILKNYVVRTAFSSSSPVSHYQLESACQSLFDVATLFHLRWCSVALTQALISQALPLPADNTNTSSLAPPLPFLILDNHSWYDKHFHQLIEK